MFRLGTMSKMSGSGSAAQRLGGDADAHIPYAPRRGIALMFGVPAEATTFGFFGGVGEQAVDSQRLQSLRLLSYINLQSR